MPDFRIEEHRGVVAVITKLAAGSRRAVIATAVILRNICHELMDGLDDSKNFPAHNVKLCIQWSRVALILALAPAWQK